MNSYTPANSSARDCEPRNEFWHRLRIAPPVPLVDGQVWALFLLGLSVALGRYDSELLSLVIPYVQPDIGISESAVASLFGLSKLGVIAGIVMGILADRFGRVRLLKLTILGFSLATAGTAFATTPTQFVIAQFWSGAFINTESGLVVVIAIEMLASPNRGWALGLGAAFAALGSGAAAIAFALVETIPGGWRTLYFVSIFGILLLAFLRRGLSEPDRFMLAQELALDSMAKQSIIEPVLALFRGMHRKRIISLSLAQALFAFGVASAFALQTKQLIEVHEFGPSDITTLFIFGGAVAIFGNILGATMADRFGRKPIIAISLSLTTVGIVGFFTASGPLMVAFWILYSFSQFAAGIVFTVYEAELFSTRQRATAGMVTNVVSTIGFTAGAAMEGVLLTVLGNHQTAVASLALVLPMAFVVVFAFLPETANRELEDISPDLEEEGVLVTVLLP